MSEEIIEPSEIIIEKNGTVRETATHVSPWIRFLARFFDYALFIFLLGAVRYLITGTPSLAQYESFVPIPFFCWIPIEALFLSTWGTTPGKFFLRTKLIPRRRGKLEYKIALRRSFNVWFRGLGMGIPVINVLCLMVAYHRLNLLRTTSWDVETQTMITHYPIGTWRIVVASIISAAGLFFYYMFVK